MPITAKWPVGRPRKRKPSAEAPPVPNINHASEILRLSDDVGQEAKWIRCQYTTKQNVMRADRTCLARSNYTNKHPLQYRCPLDLYIIVFALILHVGCPLASELFFGSAYIRYNTACTVHVHQFIFLHAAQTATFVEIVCAHGSPDQSLEGGVILAGEDALSQTLVQR